MTDKTGVLTSKTNHGNSDVAVAGCNCEACFNLRGELVNSHCAECGMALITAGEYHPYAACALYKQWGDSHAVRANLAAIIEHGNKPTGDETSEPRAPSGHVGGCMCSPCREWRLVQHANTLKAGEQPLWPWQMCTGCGNEPNACTCDTQSEPEV